MAEDNEIRIDFSNVYDYIENYLGKETFATFAVTHPNGPVIRKSHHMLGWDWGPDLADMGIYRDIYILSTEMGYLHAFRHECEFLPDGNDTPKAQSYQVLYWFMDFDGQILDEKTFTCDVDKTDDADVLVLPTPFDQWDTDKLVYVKLTDMEGNFLSENFYQHCGDKDIAYPQANISVKAVDPLVPSGKGIRSLPRKTDERRTKAQGNPARNKKNQNLSY